MKFVPERDPLPRLLAFVYLGLATLGGGGLLLWGREWERLAFCPLRRWTGFPCPTCGGTHAALALVKGNLQEAFRENPLVATAAAALAVWAVLALAATLVPSWRKQPQLTPREQNLVRILLVSALLGAWIYEVIRLA